MDHGMDPRRETPSVLKEVHRATEIHADADLTFLGHNCHHSRNVAIMPPYAASRKSGFPGLTFFHVLRVTGAHLLRTGCQRQGADHRLFANRTKQRRILSAPMICELFT